MSVIGSNFVTGNGATAEAQVASALIPRNVTSKATNPTNEASNNSSTTDTITASDFLTLLVSELKNQDPTQPTDPNAYISQLVGVNSLQQLIQINQGVTTIESSSTSTTESAS